MKDLLGSGPFAKLRFALEDQTRHKKPHRGVDGSRCLCADGWMVMLPGK